jgi:hypothetical protein
MPRRELELTIGTGQRSLEAGKEEIAGLDHDRAGSAAVGMAAIQPEQGHGLSVVRETVAKRLQKGDVANFNLITYFAATSPNGGQLDRMMQAEGAIKVKAACDELRRVSQLRDYSVNLNSPKAYFRADDDKLSNPHKRNFFVALEQDLQGLDAEAWEFLKGEALPRLKAQHSTRGWQQLFDTLNEAKGYNYLVRIDCKDIKFIPRSKANNVQTPDLRGFLDSAQVLCEVKTINVSEDEANRLATGGVGTTRLYLEKEFFDKLSSVIHTAASQLLAFEKDLTSRRIVYVVFNFDDRLHEYADEYQKQIEIFIAGASLPDVEVVPEIKPPFHSAG